MESDGLLACPHCGSALRAHGKIRRCMNRHSFDIAREGYVNLARATNKASDTKPMAEARLRFLNKRFFDPLLDRLRPLVSRALHDVAEGGRCLVDVGCGPGFYLERMFGYDRIWGGEIAEGAIGVDLSKSAIKIAAKALRDVTFAVADVEKWIPVVDGGAGVVLSVFAPRPVAGFRRIVRPDGRVVVAAAGPRHLEELRKAFGLISVRPDKEAKLRGSLERAFVIEHVERLTFDLHLGADDVRDVIAMGPNAWHRAAPENVAPMSATADILLSVARPSA
jgi:SAM-dependent methyltransferase